MLSSSSSGRRSRSSSPDVFDGLLASLARNRLGGADPPPRVRGLGGGPVPVTSVASAGGLGLGDAEGEYLVLVAFVDDVVVLQVCCGSGGFVEGAWGRGCRPP